MLCSCYSLLQTGTTEQEQLEAEVPMSLSKSLLMSTLQRMLGGSMNQNEVWMNQSRLASRQTYAYHTER